jgi:hypothetical protein
MKMSMCSKLTAVIALCLMVVSCANPSKNDGVPLYNRDGKQVVLVHKNDLNSAAPDVAYRLRKDVWARVGDALLSIAVAVVKAEVSSLKISKSDSESYK